MHNEPIERRVGSTPVARTEQDQAPNAKAEGAFFILKKLEARLDVLEVLVVNIMDRLLKEETCPECHGSGSVQWVQSTGTITVDSDPCPICTPTVTQSSQIPNAAQNASIWIDINDP